MIKTLKRVKSALISVFKKNKVNISYSQSGEDLIIRQILHQAGIFKPNYIDIGAHHPVYLNNTYLFYKDGSTGTNVEPDPTLIRAFNSKRPHDNNLNFGVSFNGSEEEMDFYIMSVRTLNTFSKEEALRMQSFGSYKIEEIRKIKTVNINNLLESSFKEKSIDLLTIDVEGLDHEIIALIDFSKYRPLVLCVETLSYAEDKTEKKNQQIINYVLGKNYMIYADTYINTIFVDIDRWNNR